MKDDAYGMTLTVMNAAYAMSHGHSANATPAVGGPLLIDRENYRIAFAQRNHFGKLT